MKQKSWVVSGADLAELEREVAVRLSVLCEPRRSLRRAWLDSFDWRLWESGRQLLDEESDGEGHALALVRGGERSHEALLSARPRFAGDLPAEVGKGLAKVLEMRALMPRVLVEGEVVWISSKGSPGEVELCGEIVSRAVRAPEPTGDPPAPLPIRLSLWGEEGAIARASEQLAGLSLQETETSELEEALAAIGREPSDYASRIDVPLQGSEPSGLAIRAVLRQIFAIWRANEAGVLSDIDTEFLHDLRVAVRRTRSVLGQLKGALPKRVGADLLERLGWLGRATGPLRDLDVFLLDLADLDLPVPDPLLDLVRSRRALALTALAETLQGETYARLVADIGAVLSEEHHKGKRASVPIRSLVGPRIVKLARRVAIDGSDLQSASDVELHDLRKTCKKLRYLTEFFGGMYQPELRAACVARLKAAQTRLGTLQDLAVQVEHLRAMSRPLADRRVLSIAEVRQIDEIIEQLRARQRQLREQLPAHIDSPSLRDTFLAMLHTPVPAT